MERLTAKSKITDGYALKDLCVINRYDEIDEEIPCCEHCECIDSNCDVCLVQKAIDKLAEYENAIESGCLVDAQKEPCQYCNGSKTMILDRQSEWMWIYNKTLEGGDFEVDIKYCPMCGREL